MSFVNETKTNPIQNDTGAIVRADINSNMAAIYSLNASTAEPSADNSVARMIWADETTNELKIRNGTNTAFITIGSLDQTNLGLAPVANPEFTGNITVPAGTVSNLPVRFSGDTDTGFFKNNADDFSVVTGGTRRAYFDQFGITIRDRKALMLRDTSNSNFVAIQAPSNVASDVTLTLPSSDGNANDVLQSDGSGNLSFTALPQAVPTGSVHIMATTTAPSGYLKCDGAAVSRTTYADLFTTIGTTWGAGDGSSTFNLPDLRGEFVRGWDNGKGTDSGRSFASFQGDDNKNHNHTLTSGGASGTFVTGVSLDQATKRVDGSPNQETVLDPGTSIDTTFGNVSYTAQTISPSGGSEARPRNIAMMYVIKT